MLSGLSFINGEWQGQAEAGFYAVNAIDHALMQPQFINCTNDQLDQACQLAKEAFVIYRQTTALQRADFLNEIANQMTLIEPLLLDRTTLETGLPNARIQGELARTVNQLKLFAGNLTKKSTLVAHDSALPERAPLPRADLKMAQLPLGPVAVFGASNFPLAFSTAGGDTASALAAGCPVVFKAHVAHPGTSEIVAKAIEKAIRICEMPKGVFSLLQCKAYDISHGLVKHPAIKAVGFTGSYRVGMALLDSIKTRKEPIPFYGELGAINPQVILPELITQDPQKLAQEFVTSMTMGAGQFCTNPGFWLVNEAEAAAFKQELLPLIEQSTAQTMLTPGILTAYAQGCDRLAKHSEVVAKGLCEDKKATTFLFSATAEEFLANTDLHSEVFGPASLMVTYKNLSQVAQIVEQLEGQLTASVHGSAQVIAENQTLIEALSFKVGRLIFNQMPTGVEVCDAMMHGGPFPCSTDVRSTSVGSYAIERFLRPICYQNQM
ncbi:NADP-dependent aldehyde dehydrogenase [Pseudoalteromonas ulvae UL12]|uniref:aldehyde dehydrogenase (NADP(+)) n=1 Tax=Pseudoalteromonas ulvae TaxID=107327 RepID=UPI00186BA194|nr:aldehyde dehydrogenase (NADP(+)) [Pseudoalteromonas ulvae]MBE0363828.1 NADP-dependent aldehyde dehydrogenase [Pseudoalteromonas ulvae UL12]